MSERRIGVLGGTFDPIHFGHLLAASESCAHFDLDEVVFVPAKQPWQKDDRQISFAADRYSMTVIATADNPHFTVSDVDMVRPGLTYTVDTLRDLRKLYQESAELFFIVGMDALAGVHSWHDAATLFELAHFIGVSRAGKQVDAAIISQLPAQRVSLLEIPALDISATDCRQRVAAGLPIDYLTPAGVTRYIAKRGLYREA